MPLSMLGALTVWSALLMASRSDPESFFELGADAWRSQEETFDKISCYNFS
jgi:hypothetical protein